MRAKNHDQRKGQWLINKIRMDPDFQKNCAIIAREDGVD